MFGMTYKKIIGAVDIGTSKVSVLVGEVDKGGLTIIGEGQSTSMGVVKGGVVDFTKVSDATHAAMNAAEKSAGVVMEEVYLSQTGGHVQGFANQGSVPIGAQDGVVSKADIRQAMENAKRKELPDGRLYIHHVLNGYLLDARSVESPLAMRGEHLDVAYWHVHGDETQIGNGVHVINGYGLDVKDIILSSIASGSIIASKEEKDSGVLVVDIGRGTTDYVLYRNGRVQRTGVLRVGGDHFTNDLSIGLRVNYRHAERLKRDYGKAVAERSDGKDKVWLFGDYTIGDRQIPQKAIVQILKARADELFAILKKELSPVLGPDALAGGVLLTGGGSRLPGMEDSARRALGMEARASNCPDWVRQDLRQPEYATVIGLLYYGMSAQGSPDAQGRGGNIISRVTGFFR